MIYRITALIIYYLYTGIRNKSRLVDIFLWPVLELSLYGFLSAYIRTQTAAISLVTVIILGGLIFWHFFGRTMNEIVTQFLDDAYSRNLNNILVSPIRLSEFIIALIIAALVKLSLSMIIILPLSWFFYRLNIFTLGPITIYYFFILTLWGVSLGLVTTSAYFILGSRAGALSWAIAGIIQPFSLVFYPRLVLPQIIQKVSYLIPASYIFESIRNQLTESKIIPQPIIIATLMTFSYLIVAILVFYMAFQRSRYNGMITKL